MDNDFIFDIDGLMNEGKFEEAIGMIQELDEDEMSDELMFMLAHCFSQCARYREALDVLGKIENVAAEDDLSYHLEIAGANYGLHKYRSAIREADRCIEIDDSCVEAWLLLCLIYQETGNESKFERASRAAKEIDEEAWDNIFGDKTDELAGYDDGETAAVIKYISDTYGDIGMLFPDFGEDDINYKHPIKVAVIPPDREHPFFKLITIGIGAYRGIEITDNGEENIHRVELAAYIPLSGMCDDDVSIHIWVSRIMRQFGEMVQLESSWLGFGHTVSYGDKLDESVEYNGVVFAPAVDDDKKCILPCGEEVEFLLLIALYEEEMDYKIGNGFMKLL